LFIRRSWKRTLGHWIPPELWIGVTYRCQCKCVHCVIGERINARAPELSGEQVKDLIHTARAAGILEVSFMGGEPLVRAETYDFIAYASSRGLLTSLYTNGIFLDGESVRRLKRAGLYSCNVSLDSAVPEVHDRKRNFPGCHKKAVAALTHLVENDITCSIFTYASKAEVRDNDLRDLKEIISLGRRLQVNSVTILFPIASGNWFCSQNEVLTLEEREKVRTLWDPPFVKLEHPSEESMCNAGRRFVYVSPQGEMIACPCIPFAYGDIRKEPFSLLAGKVSEDMCQHYEKFRGECIMQKPEFRSHLAQKRGEAPEKWDIETS
jgi:MoaA/NifB/PqqE/SkfB family radical SAM enzyme